LDKNCLRYAGAGHPPLLLCRASSGKAAKVIENGLVIGMFPEATYAALELPLEPGDRIVLYTDGIPEAANPAQQEFGVDRFMRFVENNKSLYADQFADAFLDEISRWMERSPEQGQQDDDITLLVIGRSTNLTA
jgi:serine phosphatase RsbU (regulator of sigma subunit)